MLGALLHEVSVAFYFIPAVPKGGDANNWGTRGIWHKRTRSAARLRLKSLLARRASPTRTGDSRTEPTKSVPTRAVNDRSRLCATCSRKR